MMYDQRLKAQRDYQWGLDSARQEGMEKGMEKGMKKAWKKAWKKAKRSGRSTTPRASRRRVEFHRKSARTDDRRTVHHAGGFAAASAVARILTEWRVWFRQGCKILISRGRVVGAAGRAGRGGRGDCWAGRLGRAGRETGRWAGDAGRETLGGGRSERGIPGAVCRVHALRCVPGRMAAGRAARLEQQAAMSTRQGRTGSRELGNSARRGRQRAGESGAGAAEGRSRLADGDPVAMLSLVTGSRCGSAGRAARRRKMLHRADKRGRRGAQRQRGIAGGLAGGGAAHCGHRPLRGFLGR
jgi:hypothetical protein